MVWLIFGFKIYGYFRMVTGMVMDLLLKPVILHRPTCENHSKLEYIGVYIQNFIVTFKSTIPVKTIKSLNVYNTTRQLIRNACFSLKSQTYFYMTVVRQTYT